MSSAVRAGYKQTEVGVIPVDWTLVNIASVSDMITVGFVGSMAHLFTKIGVPLLRGQDVKPNRLNLSNTEFISIDTHKLWKKSALEAGDVVIVRVGASAGMACVIPKGVGNANAASLVVVRPNTHKLSAVFLSQLINSRFGEKQIESLLVGGAQPVINTSTAANFKLALPPIAEQRAIATALSDVDALLAKLDALIAKKRDLKVATMQQLLTGQTRLPGFSGEWEVKRLGDVASATKGTQLDKLESNESGLFAHLNGGVTPSGFTSVSNTPGQTIAISEGGNSCGFVQFMDKPYWCGGHCYSIVPTRIANGFLYHALKGRQADIMGLRVGSGLPNVQKTALLNFQLNCPIDMSEQNAIATTLTDMDAELTALETRRDKTRALKQGMMQELLTGRIRLI